jgi:hypothetical protein
MPCVKREKEIVNQEGKALTKPAKASKGEKGKRDGDERDGREDQPKSPKKTKPKYLTKSARPDPRNTDPTISAARPEEEEFCDLMAQGYSGTRAYLMAVNPQSKTRTATCRASEMRRRPDLARRIIALQDTRYKPKSGRKPMVPPTVAPEASEKPTQPPAPSEQAQPLSTSMGLVTRADLEQIISAAVRQASTSTEKTQAVKMARDMLGLDRPEDAPVDPTALLDYISRAAGRTPEELARETGGLRYMLERVAAFSRQPQSVVIRTVSAWLRAMKQATMATGEATPDEPDA